MIGISTQERRARLGLRHLLAHPGEGPVEVARALVALHSSDPATVFLSIMARSPKTTVPEIEQALYEERSLMRLLGMRRTLWVVPADTAEIVDSSSTRGLIAGQRKRTAGLFESAGLTDDGEAWYEDVSARVLDSLVERGEATAREMTQDVPELGNKITFYKKDGSPAGESGVSTRILFMLATEGKIVRARPLGSWISSQYRWSTTRRWIGHDLEMLDRRATQRALLESWLLSFGPALESDIKWWTGWPVTQVRAALEGIRAVEVQMEEGVGVIHPDDDGVPAEAPPWAALLPGLDPTAMGWKDRGWYMGGHATELTDRNGNIGPTVWADGRVVGGWGQAKTGEVIFEVLEDVGAGTTRALEEAAAAMEDRLGGVVVTPRFRSPHHRRLTARA